MPPKKFKKRKITKAEETRRARKRRGVEKKKRDKALKKRIQGNTLRADIPIPRENVDQNVHTIYKDRLIVRRIDKKEKWFYNHVAYIIINSPQSTYLYKEEGPNNADMFVSYKNQRVCNSRCPTYTLGWG